METALSIAEITRYLVLLCVCVILLLMVPAPAVFTLLLIISSLLSLFRRSEMSEALLLHFDKVNARDLHGSPGAASRSDIFFHPDYTVGTGVTPVRLP
jgi:hypothetical protein